MSRIRRKDSIELCLCVLRGNWMEGIEEVDSWLACSESFGPLGRRVDASRGHVEDGSVCKLNLAVGQSGRHTQLRLSAQQYISIHDLQPVRPWRPQMPREGFRGPSETPHIGACCRLGSCPTPQRHFGVDPLTRASAQEGSSPSESVVGVRLSRSVRITVRLAAATRCQWCSAMTP